MQEKRISTADENVVADVSSASTEDSARDLLHNQFVAAVICGDTDAVTNFLSQKEIDVNVLCVVRNLTCCVHFLSFLKPSIVHCTR